MGIFRRLRRLAPDEMRAYEASFGLTPDEGPTARTWLLLGPAVIVEPVGETHSGQHPPAHEEEMT